jgi:FMN-dependent oxidoreductase (nitrilotriacetate monooxygenase family)
MKTRKMKLNFHANSAGVHPEAWREPYSATQNEFGIEYYHEIARISERGLFDAIFFADTVGMHVGRRRPNPIFDPLVIVASISAVTDYIGLVISTSTTFNAPYNVARQFSTLDHVSKGRAGWNVVTTYNETAAPNFGLDVLPKKEDRYSLAEEFVDVVLGLWDSWDYEALRTSDTNIRQPRPIEHLGKYFRVKGPLQTPLTPQGRPVIFQAGQSPEGRELAARTAEGVFFHALTASDGRAFRSDLRSRAMRLGRSPDEVNVFPGVYVHLVQSTEEIAEVRESLQGGATPEQGLKTLAAILAADPTELELDSPVPKSVIERAMLKAPKRGQVESLAAIFIQERSTIRQFLDQQPGSSGTTHRIIIGTPTQVADSFEEWFTEGAADGFNVGNLSPEKLAQFVDEVVPLLQKRGLYRTEYKGRTLRSHYREDLSD